MEVNLRQLKKQDDKTWHEIESQNMKDKKS